MIGMMMRASIATALAVSSLLIAPAAFASIVVCPDGTEFDTSAITDAFVIRTMCADHQGSVETSPSIPADPVNDADPGGTWVYDGPVCDNVGICASSLLCPDGTPMTKYVFVADDGTRGESQVYCPGDPDIPPVPEVVPPTAGQIFTAFKKVVPPAAALAIQPPDGKTLVNFETVFSTTAEAFTTSRIKLLPGFFVTFDIKPTAFTWKFGDGTELITDTPGRPFAPGDDASALINHVYTSTSPVKASVITTWGATVRLNEGPATPVEGTVDVTSEPIALEILEAKPELVR